MEPQCPAGGRTHLVAKFMGTLGKRASPLIKGPPCPWALSFQELLVLPTYFPFQVFVLGRRKTWGKRTLCSLDNSLGRGGTRSHLLPVLYMRAAITRRAKAALFGELPHLSWPISSSFYKDLGWAVRAKGKRPLKKGSKSYSRTTKLLPKGRAREAFVHDGGTTPRPHKPEAQHQQGLCP